MNKIQIAATFYDAHDALKNILGKKFDETNKPYREEIFKQMNKRNLPVMDACMECLKIAKEAVTDIQDRTVATMQFLAAAVEIMKDRI